MNRFSKRHRFSDWPNVEVPAVAAGVYAIWDDDALMYCGMAGRALDAAKAANRLKTGLISRLGNHASGRLSGDQFCVYVANRLVLPNLKPEQLRLFATGALTLDSLTKTYIHTRFEYQFAKVETTREAYDLESDCRKGVVFGAKPFLNPAKD